MNTILFNFHDVLMVLTAFECLLFATLLGLTNRDNALSTWFLVAYLMCHFLIPLHELTFWGSQFRIWLLDKSPNLFFIGSYAYFLDGVLLYFFVRAMLFKDFRWKPAHWLHLVPIVVYAIGMIFIFYAKDYSTKFWLIKSQHIAYSSPYLYLEASGRYLRLTYALLCFSLIMNYSQQLKNEFANLKLKEITWLKIMVGCFVALFAWDALLLSIKISELFKNYFNLDLLNVVGLSSYYLNFAVINILIFLRFILFTSVSPVNEASAFDVPDFEAEILTQNAQEHKADKSELVSQQVIADIEHAMIEQKFYANPEISLDRLAEEVKLHPRKLSIAIKLHYHLNFYEFVNSYRINEAKRLLKDPAWSRKTITDIYNEVGFNSKSVFNSFFKRQEGMTPSQYRENNADD